MIPAFSSAKPEEYLDQVSLDYFQDVPPPNNRKKRLGKELVDCRQKEYECQIRTSNNIDLPTKNFFPNVYFLCKTKFLKNELEFIFIIPEGYPFAPPDFYHITDIENDNKIYDSPHLINNFMIEKIGIDNYEYLKLILSYNWSPSLKLIDIIKIIENF